MRLFSVVVAVATLLVVATTAAAGPGPTPLPVGPDGLPDVRAQVDALGENEFKLLALKPAGSESWYAPADLDVRTRESQIVSGTFKPKLHARAAAPRDSQQTSFGCFVNAYAPSFVYPSVIQGNEDFFSCINVAFTQADICLKESSTYGLHACVIRYHAGNGSWTAWSEAFGCQSIQRSWKTQGSNLYTAVSGHTALWGFSSNWEPGYFC